MKVLLSLVLVFCPAIVFAAGSEKPSPIGKKVANFKLRDYRGAESGLADFGDRKLVVLAFVGTECPVAKLYGPRLAALAREFEPKGVAFVAISANQQDSVSSLANFAKLNGISFPILKDVGNVVADKLGALRTPEVFVLDEQRAIRYWGRIDDQYGIGYARPKATRRDLAVALEELLAGKAVTTAAKEAPGCFIGRVRQEARRGDVTYARHIAPILQKRCVECHQPGEVGPFSLTTYDEVIGWTETIRDVVKDRRMPPWFADPKYGQFSNDCHLPEEERQLILKWIDDDAPRGDLSEAPRVAEPLHGWRIPKPDLVVSMPQPFKVPAQGTVPYQFFVIDPGFKEDKWVKAAEVRPGCRPAVHHVLVFVQPPDKPNMGRTRGFISDWLVSTVPGATPMIMPDGMAKRVPAGSRFLIQVHYTPTGKPESDQTSVALVFADPKTIKQEVMTDMAVNNRFLIPANADNHPVEAAKTLERDTLVLTLMPHTHLRGKAFKYEATYPTGEKEILLDVPHYDFNWQTTYVLAKPKLLPRGTLIHCVAHYNNSKSNFSNPNSNASVRWGEQTWEEMMIGYFDSTPANQDLLAKPLVEAKAAPRETATLDPELQILADRALDSQQAFDTFAAAVHKALPKVDRVCVTTFADEKLRVVRASYPGQVSSKVAETGFESPQGRFFAVAQYGLLNMFMAHPDLKDRKVARGADLSMMSSTLASSVHIPTACEGRPGTVNFWSKEKDAFPKQTHALMRALAEAVTKGR